MTTAQLRDALNALKAGKSLYRVAEDMKLDPDTIWQSARHFGYYTAPVGGRFIIDRQV